MDTELYRKIVSEYRKSGSVDITAKRCGTYPIKVRKVLITEGLWHSKRSDKINALRMRGYSVSEIAEDLHMDEKNVQYYLPYTEKAMAREKTGGGERVRAFRDRNRNAARGSFDREQEMNLREKQKEQVSYPEKAVCRKKEQGQMRETNAHGSSLRAAWSGYLLHAELVSAIYDPEEDCEDIFEGEENPEILRSLLKTRHGISRDLIVPGGMSLHQLSYALQKAFGFQNCHLHHFALPKKLLRQLTDDRTALWAEMCGVYLHAPVDEDFEDLYWDDDYREGKSPNAWMRSKYTGESDNYAVGETFIDTLRLMQEEPGEYEGNRNRVLERLKVQEIFDMQSLSVSATESWRRLLQENNRTSRTYLENCRGTYSYQSLEEGLSTLRFMREERHRIDYTLWLKKNGIREGVEGRPEELMEKIDQEIHELEHHLGPAMHAFDPPAMPVTDTLYYNYDYGDDWLIRITCREIYTRWEQELNIDEESEKLFERVGEVSVARESEIERKLVKYVLRKDFSDEYDYTDLDGNLANDALRFALIRAELNKEPVCVMAEGLPPVEDVGGISGLFEFLKAIHGEDAEEAARMRQWARGLGWKEVRPRAEGLL